MELKILDSLVMGKQLPTRVKKVNLGPTTLKPKKVKAIGK